jgi:CPA2 family monovalent cation:H+ antiporter-2
MQEFTLLGFIAMASLFSVLISLKLRTPSVILLLIFGMVLGPHGFGLIKESEIIDFLSEIGGIFLLFLIGFEFNFSRIKKFGAACIVIFLLEFFFLFFLIYFPMRIFFERNASIFLAIIFSITSTALVITLLKELKQNEREEVPLLVGISMAEDISILFIISVLSSLLIEKMTFSLELLFFPLIKSFLLITLITLLAMRALPFISSYLPDREDVNLMLCIFFLSFFVWLTSILNLSSSVGAFIAGSIISVLPGRKIKEVIEGNSILFISIFFLLFGMQVNPYSLLKNFGIILLLSFLVIFGKIASIALGFLLFGYSFESSIFAGASMVPVGEVSLLLASLGVKNGIFGSEFMGITSCVVMITSLLSFPLIKSHEKITEQLRKMVPRAFLHSLSKVSVLKAQYFFARFGSTVWRNEMIKNSLEYFAFLSLLFYLNLPFHTKDITITLLTLVLLFFSFSRFYKILKECISLTILSFSSKTIYKKRSIRKNLFLSIALVLIMSTYAFLVQELTSLNFIFIVVILIFLVSLVSFFHSFKFFIKIK